MSDPNSTEILAALSRDLPVGMLYVNASGTVQLWSAEASAILEWSTEEMLGRPLPEPLAATISDLAPRLQQEEQLNHTLNCLKRGGGSTEIRLRFKTFRGRNGELNGYMAFFWDNTPDRTAQAEKEELIASERASHAAAEVAAKAESRFRELLEVAPDAIIEVDSRGSIILCNAATERLFGYRREELLGSPVETLIPEGSRDAHKRHRADYWQNPVTRPMGKGLTLHAQRKDGSRFPVEISLSPVRSEEGFRVTAIIRDVTDRMIAEEQIRAVNQQLQQRNQEVERANRLKSEFLASMSHELRTPLHTILGFTELLAEEVDGPLNDRQKRFVSHVHQDAQHLLELINDILDLSKIEAGKMDLRFEVFDALQAIKEVVASLQGRADAKNLTVENRVAADCAVKADRVRFKEIFYNLLSNAVKFTLEGGRIEIAASMNESRVCFSVKDTGIGIPKSEQASIFDKFYQVGSTTKGVREGTGLGLAITKQLVEMHGGRILVESTPGQGSTFTFTVPTEAPRKQDGKPVILIVEDEPSAQELLVTYLEPRGFHTEVSPTIQGAIEIARKTRPSAVTLDLGLPGYSGWRALEELHDRAEFRSVPIIVVSVRDNDGSAQKRGAVAFLQKPLKREVLIQTLRQHLQ
jgi:PAS domain S-box-containing protein